MNEPVRGKMVGAYKAGKMWDGTSAVESDQENGLFSTSDLVGLLGAIIFLSLHFIRSILLV
jgi:hypothetical protein